MTTTEATGSLLNAGDRIPLKVSGQMIGIPLFRCMHDMMTPYPTPGHVV